MTAIAVRKCLEMFFGIIFLASCVNPPGSLPPPPVGEPLPSVGILFVTQVPIHADFTTIGSTFGNHGTAMTQVGRGGDLWIRYNDGSLKNLTKAAGFGVEGFQNNQSISVRDPSVHWDGRKAIFSMVIGAPNQNERYLYTDYFWQLFEISGLGKSENPVITKIPNQPANYNNISPVYATDDKIIFTSDRPRGGETHLYPQLDEYEEAPTVTGLWKLDSVSGELLLLNHAPSGDFSPIVDSFGRVIFTQWDHLQRDQQADTDNTENGTYGTFNYASESANASRLNTNAEIFPEPREGAAGSNVNGHGFNQFFPWMILEDGTESEVVNHLGRHEFGGEYPYLPPNFNNDPNLLFYTTKVNTNKNGFANMLQIKEDPAKPGSYIGADSPEFGTHASGHLVSFEAPPGLSPEQVVVNYITQPDADYFRDPLPLSNGGLVASHFAKPATEGKDFFFRIRTLKKSTSGYWGADQYLTNGIVENISYWSPDELVEFSGEMWELNPVEVRSRPRPAKLMETLETPEQQMFDQAGVNVDVFKKFLVDNGLALAVSRDLTTRDDQDRQQPFNLRVPGGKKTTATGGKIYDISHLQFFQADQIRGLGGTASPAKGRRVLAQILHDPKALANNPVATGPAGSVELGLDGSMAAFVPARRAMTWQLTDPNGAPVIRERYWLTFQPGEIRVCASCHGLSKLDQAGNPSPENPPQALLKLLQKWKQSQ